MRMQYINIMAHDVLSHTSHLLLLLPKKNFSCAIVFELLSLRHSDSYFCSVFIVFQNWFNFLGLLGLVKQIHIRSDSCCFSPMRFSHSYQSSGIIQGYIPQSTDKSGQIPNTYTISIPYFMSACVYLSLRLFEKVLFFRSLPFAARLFIIYFH